MCIVTFHLYLFFWFYKNWQYVRDQKNEQISVFWRTIFFPLMSYALLDRIREDVEAINSKEQVVDVPQFPSGILAIALFLLFSIAPTYLDDPYWLVSFLAFTVLVPPLRAINALNGHSGFHYSRNSTLNVRHYILMVICVPLLALACGSSFGVLPPTSAIAGADLTSWQRKTIGDLSGIENDEQILFFYSNSFLSYRHDGNVVTDQRLISYFTDEIGQEQIGATKFDEIVELHVLRGSFFEPSVIVVCLEDDTYLYLLTSPDFDGDQMLNKIQMQLPGDVPYIVESTSDFTCAEVKGA